MKKTIILLVIVGAVGFLWWSFKPELEIVPAGSEGGGAVIEITKNPVTIVDKVSPVKEVIYQNNALSPATLTVKVGDMVRFVNRHVAPIRIASNPHPIHTSFGDFESDTLAPGESYEFTFTKKMTLDYHNHFNPGVGGKIVVVE